jgi:hypothetical protein
MIKVMSDDKRVRIATTEAVARQMNGGYRDIHTALDAAVDYVLRQGGRTRNNIQRRIDGYAG